MNILVLQTLFDYSDRYRIIDPTSSNWSFSTDCILMFVFLSGITFLSVANSSLVSLCFNNPYSTNSLACINSLYRLNLSNLCFMSRWNWHVLTPWLALSISKPVSRQWKPSAHKETRQAAICSFTRMHLVVCDRKFLINAEMKQFLCSEWAFHYLSGTSQNRFYSSAVWGRTWVQIWVQPVSKHKII